MFTVFLLILIITIIIGISCEIVMRVRLTKLETPHEKLLWWRRGGDEVSATYHELYPRSPLPIFRHLTFGILILGAFIVLVLVLLKRKLS